MSLKSLPTRATNPSTLLLPWCLQYGLKWTDSSFNLRRFSFERARSRVCRAVQFCARSSKEIGDLLIESEPILPCTIHVFIHYLFPCLLDPWRAQGLYSQ